MSVQDITPDSVLAAVLAGQDDAYKLCEHFGVIPRSHTLTEVIAQLVEQDRLVLAHPAGFGSTPRLVVA